jgi:hypothetical protein
MSMTATSETSSWGRNDRYLILGPERQVSGVSPVRSRWPEERSKSAVNDIVATQYVRGRWGRLRGIVALSLLPTGTYRDKPFSGLVVGATDRLGAGVEHNVWAVFEPWFAEAGAVVNVVRDETGSFVTAHQASTQSQTM